jgi:hypothetical protein
MPLQKDGVKAQAITHAIGMIVAVDLRPYSIVENEGFRELLKILEPQYSIISRRKLTNNVIPELFSDLKEKNLKIVRVIGKSGELYNRHVEVRRPESGIHDGYRSLGC